MCYGRRRRIFAQNQNSAYTYFPEGEIAKLREKVRRRAFLVRSRVKLRVKVKSVLTYEGLKWPSDHGLFTQKGVE
jgi:hypothetical protein